jgi:hypothetical protein
VCATYEYINHHTHNGRARIQYEKRAELPMTDTDGDKIISVSDELSEPYYDYSCIGPPRCKYVVLLKVKLR